MIKTERVEIEVEVSDIADVIAERLCTTTDQYDKMILDIEEDFSPVVRAEVTVEYDTDTLEIHSVSTC